MTTNEASALMARLLAAFPSTQATEPTLALYLERLRPLPFAWTERAVEGLILTHPYPTVPAIAEVMRVCRITDDDARNQLLEAMRLGQPLVRDAASVTGWAVGTAKYPPEALPPPAPALAEPVVAAEKRRDLVGRIKALAGALRGEA